jgi:hypothetical protein
MKKIKLFCAAMAAENSMGQDSFGCRRGFLNLVKEAKRLKG